MSFQKHCDLCCHQQTSLQVGMTCGLTNKTPNFKNTCPNIQLKDSVQEKLELLSIEIERIKQRKNSILVRFYISILIGFVLIISGFTFLIYFSDVLTYDLPDSMVVISVGFTSLFVGYRLLNTHRKELKLAKTKKRNIDTLLHKYQIRYTTKIKFGKKYHGVQEVQVALEMKGRFSKRTSTTYKIDC